MYAKCLAAKIKDAKVVVCSPSEWIGNQVCAHFKETKEVELIDKTSGIFPVEQIELAKIP